VFSQHHVLKTPSSFSHKTSKIIVLGIIMITFFRRERCRYMI
jgi:hypothetical protein